MPTSPNERVEAWAVSQAADVLAAISISSPSPASHRTSSSKITMDIPLDDSIHVEPTRPRTEGMHTVYKRSELMRRDSQRRRDALLQGKKGSRRRRRWENDRLLSNPHAQPPLPSDWEVHPTHSKQHVPYFLAPLWDAEFARLTEERKRRADAASARANPEEIECKKVTQELREKLKKSRAAKHLLQDLEQEIRGFVEEWKKKSAQLERDGLVDCESEDDEIVFVGRNGITSDERQGERQEDKVERDKLIFQAVVDDRGAAFGRYLVHQLGFYYGLQTWSVTTGDPARREAYVGLKVHPQTRRLSLTRSEMPRPLWTVV